MRHPSASRQIFRNNGDGFAPSARPPPSTLAAQLVQENANTRSSDGPDSEATFSLLLEEVIAHPEDLESDWAENLKLVSVIAKSGLRNDPFNDYEARTSQIRNCLEAILLAFRKTPELMFRTIESSAPPLFVSLLPPLLALLGPSSTDTLRSSCRTFLSDVLQRIAEDSAHWQAFVSLLSFLSHVAKDAVESFQSAQFTGAAQIPSRKTRVKTMPEAAVIPTLSNDTFTLVRGIEHSALIVVTIVTCMAQVAKDWNGARCHRDALVQPIASILRALNRQIRLNGMSWPKRVLEKVMLLVLQTGLNCRKLIELGPKLNLDDLLLNNLVTMCDVNITRLDRSWQHTMSDVLARLENSITVSELFAHRASVYLDEDRLKFLADVKYSDEDATQELHATLRRLQQNLHPDYYLYGERPSKRRRTEVTAKESSRYDILKELSTLAGLGSLVSDAGALEDRIDQVFDQLDGQQQLEILALYQRLHTRPTTNTSERHGPSFVGSSGTRLAESEEGAEIKDAPCSGLKRSGFQYRLLIRMTTSHAFQNNRDIRVQSLNLIRLLLTCCPSYTHLLLTSALGKACFQGLRSSSREIRIAAANAVPVFVATDSILEEADLRKNRVLLMESLRQMSEARDIHQQEAVILALGGVARSAGDEELNIALLKLTEYLGETNVLISSLADLELRQLSSHFDTSLEEIFRPFWRSVAITAVKDMTVRPQLLQRLSDLLGISAAQFLALTQEDTIPWLVLWRRRDLLEKVAGSSKTDESGGISNVLMRAKNLVPTLALLIAQPSEDIHPVISEALSHVSTELDNEDVTRLLKSHEVKLACELLKMAGSSEGKTKQDTLEGLIDYVHLVTQRPRQTRSNADHDFLMASFMEGQALGIMVAFSDAMESPGTSPIEKRRLLRAIRELIVLAGPTIAIAVPQIRACLQSALADSKLCNQAMTAWLAIIPVLQKTTELPGIIQNTFTLVAASWPLLSLDLQRSTYDAIDDLVRSQSSLISDMVEKLPSLEHIEVFTKIDSQLTRLKSELNTPKILSAFVARCLDENNLVVSQALHELERYLLDHQQTIHESVVSLEANTQVSSLLRALLDVCSKHAQLDTNILTSAARCLGIIGCIDPNRLEAVRENKELVVVSNFESAPEAIDFVIFFLDNILVKAFHSISNPRAQGFLAYVMQELLQFAGFNKDSTNPYRMSSSQSDDAYGRWIDMPESTRNTLTPFLTSRYVLRTLNKNKDPLTYPIYQAGMDHNEWLWTFVGDLLLRSVGENAQKIFHLVSRVVKGFDVSIATFLLPYACLNTILGGTVSDFDDVMKEMLTILKTSMESRSSYDQEQLKKSSENVFQVLDYLSRWLQLKRKQTSQTRSLAARANKPIDAIKQAADEARIQSVESIFNGIPADVISQRAVECGAFTRALLHWENHIRQKKTQIVRTEQLREDDDMYARLQKIYSEIDEPDCIEGIMTSPVVIDLESQMLAHQRAGRWDVAHTHYENQLYWTDGDPDVHIKLLECLQRAGQHQLILKHAETLTTRLQKRSSIESIVSEALWSSARVGTYQSVFRYVPGCQDHLTFNAFLVDALTNREMEDEPELFRSQLEEMRKSVALTLDFSATSSLKSCHNQLFRLHALYEIELISGINPKAQPSTIGLEDDLRDAADLEALLSGRIALLGSSTSDMERLLNIRRAVMMQHAYTTTPLKVSELWLASSRLARKAGNFKLAYDSILRAFDDRNDGAMIEQARLLWKLGEHKKAISALEGAIAAKVFEKHGDAPMVDISMSTTAPATEEQQQNFLSARARLLLAKWLDQAGQTPSNTINLEYQKATREFHRWEKGLYHLGRFYNKLLDSERAQPPSKQSLKYISGETAKLVVENYMRSLVFGCKYISKTLPKLLTLWLDIGAEAKNPISKEVPEDIRSRAHDTRIRMVDTLNKQVKKYGEKIATYLLYTALPQMITRVGHSNPKVYEVLSGIILRVSAAHPQQALWSLLAIVKSSSADRALKGRELLNKLREKGKSVRHENNSVELKTLVNQGQKLSDQLLKACEKGIDGRQTTVSLSRDLDFTLGKTASPLVVPFERFLTASLPSSNDSVSLKAHKAFPPTREATTIASFQDEVTVLTSLQRPRKITLLGSDGKKYSLLCKPHDDLRKDQRLMEFNTMINRSLKKDSESSKRELYVRTYAVTPLNELCGLIEWVDGLKPMRDILLNSYRSKGVKIDYQLLRELLDNACKPGNPDGHKVFEGAILPMYPPVLHEWFTELFPAPDAWFTARLRYARSCAVSSMVGHALGLGDRHGENVLLEEGTGGVFHVDFNCLFDKGLTFEKPELVPFRLTHNMVDAFGAYGVEGPFRRAAECAMSVMRANEDGLLTILETFVYDPTADFVGARKRPVKGVPESPREVLESVRSKLRGLMKGDNVPLSVGGHVDALIRQATDPKNLCSMYIGWCAFL